MRRTLLRLALLRPRPLCLSLLRFSLLRLRFLRLSLLRLRLLVPSLVLISSTVLHPLCLCGQDAGPAAAIVDDSPPAVSLRKDRAKEGDFQPGPRGTHGTAPAAARPTIPLARRRQLDRQRPAARQSLAAVRWELRPLLTAAASLGMVLGLFFIAAWALRRTLPAAHGRLPAEVFEVLGRAPLAGRQQVFLARLGNKLLLICLAPSGPCTLGEIDQPEEVERLTGLCAQFQPHSSTAAFKQALAEASQLGALAGQRTRGERHA